MADLVVDPTPVPQAPIAARLGVNQLDPDEWKEATEKYESDMFEFFLEYRNGHPYKLDKASEEVVKLLDKIRQNPEWQTFRYQIQETVRSMKNVDTMICLGLGKYLGSKGPGNKWVEQYTAFVYMWEQVDRKWQDECRAQGNNHPTPVARIFQDPDFDLRTEYLFCKIARRNDPGTNVIVEHPIAIDMIRRNRNTFVYAPHLPCRMDPLILSYMPQVFVGNSSQGRAGWDQAVLEEYIVESKFDNIVGRVGPKAEDMLAKIQLAKSTYGETRLIFEDEVAAPHFGRLSIFQRPV